MCAHQLTLENQRDTLTSWLFEKALPLWSETGLDRVQGGCFETIGLDGNGTAAARRGRLHPRQIYVFQEAGRMGWNGSWERAAIHCYDYMVSHYATEQGYIANLASADGEQIDSSFILYNQAFALLALASLAATAEGERKLTYIEQGRALLELLLRHYKHPTAGFEEAQPTKDTLCSNPHMHLFEAMQAWMPVDHAGKWQAVAQEIADLALDHMFDYETGIGEFFDRNWNPKDGAAGERLEPGHQYEWAWLLAHWYRKTGQVKALEAARELYKIAELHGLDEKSGLVFMAMDRSYNVVEATCRLWGQTERLKTALVLGSLAESDVEKGEYDNAAIAASVGLQKYFEGVPVGLWKDKYEPDGSFVEEAAPASSLYHIVAAISEFRQLVPIEAK
ncbi:mannose-6-phosphate isomerase [Rhodobacteraceae bacterium RKSG542]|uniref:AGE family epimerase/isomerase n=1 Tax=Pseudovibrio flavus TaxID=2529854 RepID=UPI0012BD54E4|nr:AGE family epimerase/isomerase [Pseudovibrio flavus]MTI16493.1 mannose-6-phosphate isomerase [Pseudovibrio flavus]